MVSVEIQRAKAFARKAFEDSQNFQAHMASARMTIEALLDDSPNDISALTGLGAVLSDLGLHYEALVVLKRAVHLGSTDANTFINLGVAIINTGDHQEAMDAFKQSQKLNPNPDTWQAYFDPQAQ